MKWTIATRSSAPEWQDEPWRLWSDGPHRMSWDTQEEAAEEALNQVRQGHVMNSVIAVVPVARPDALAPSALEREED